MFYDNKEIYSEINSEKSRMVNKKKLSNWNSSMAFSVVTPPKHGITEWSYLSPHGGIELSYFSGWHLQSPWSDLSLLKN